MKTPCQHSLGRVRLLCFLTLAFGLTGDLVQAQHSIARQWNDELLEAIRIDLARPTVHARNLFHTSIAMWDAWAAYDRTARTYLNHERANADDVAMARAESLSFAVYRILSARFSDSPGADRSLPAFDAKMEALGFDQSVTTTEGDSPAALGNRIAETVLAFGLSDGANEANGYENQFYEPANPPLVPALPGNPDIIDPNRWQPLALDFFIDQGGNLFTDPPDFLSPEWGQVVPFSLTPEDLTIYRRNDFDYWVYQDPGPPPLVPADTQVAGLSSEDYYKWGFEMVSVWSSHLDPSDGVMWDISPASLGNARLPENNEFEAYYNFAEGGDWGTGYELNPVTGEPYTPQLVPRGDYTRVLAEFWADGPDSETPPGHWFVIANFVSDHPMVEKRIGGQGPLIDDLEWDVKMYLALGGAMHDAAVAAWGIKGWYDYLRPISALRRMADLGQSSDPGGPSYHPDGIRLYPGLIEVITEESSAEGERHERLSISLGKIAILAWRGPSEIVHPDFDTADVGWILAENWWPYQRPTFVTPPFAGYISGHSTFSRAAAEVLTRLTGSPYFPGGLGEFLAPQNEFLVFEDGPSVDVTLQWASYYDASDQTSLSRIWGGIHPPADDLPGRQIGAKIGQTAYALALDHFGVVKPLYFAQFADGNGLFSQIILFNLSDSTEASATLTLKTSAGLPLSVDLNGESVDGTLDVTIPASGLLQLKTDSMGDLVAGSVTVTSNKPLSGVVVFGGTVGLAGVGSSVELASGFSAPMVTDSVQNIDTGIAVMNLENEEVVVHLTLLDSEGNVLDTAEITLAAMGHFAKFLNTFDWITDADKSNVRGTLRVTSSGSVAATVIQSRPSQFATMPVTPN